MKVLHVAETAQGGVGSYLEEIVPLQVRRYGLGQVRAVLPHEHLRHFPRLASEWVTAFPLGASARPVGAGRMASYAVQVVRGWRPDVVHLHSTFAGLVMRPLLAAMPHQPKVVYSAHGWAFEREGSRLQTAVARTSERILARLSDALLCVSQHEVKQARALGMQEHRLRVVLSGLRDTDSSAPRAQGREHHAASLWPDGALRVLFVGRLDRQKGVDVLFDAMVRLNERAFAVVVGAAVAGADAEGHGVPSNVAILGWRSRAEIEHLYASADVLVIPSRWEALPLVVLEAMRAGLPVVASRVGGMAEMVEDGVTGRLVDSGDAAQLADVVAGLDRETLRRMGSEARQRFVQHFQVGRVVDELDAVYSALAESASRKRA